MLARSGTRFQLSPSRKENATIAARICIYFKAKPSGPGECKHVREAHDDHDAAMKQQKRIEKDSKKRGEKKKERKKERKRVLRLTLSPKPHPRRHPDGSSHSPQFNSFEERSTEHVA